MADLTDRQHTSSSNAALAALLPADRPALSADEPDPADTTSFLHGAAAFSPKVNAARKASLNDPFGLYAAATKAKKDAHDEEIARQLANLARWNTEKTTVGGVDMTNAEAQAARQRVIENADAYADRLIAEGKLREDEREEFKRIARRQYELADKRGRGIQTDAEAEEERRLNRSRVGQAADAATGHAHQERMVERTAEAERSKADRGLSGSNNAASRRVFEDYDASTRIVVKTDDAPAVAAKVKSTGLEL